jgi:phosphomethylpyrimidine synthase
MKQISEEFKKHGAELYLPPTHDAVNGRVAESTTENVE